MFDAALGNGGAGNPEYLIKPDKTVKKSPTATDINTAGGNVQHVCGGDLEVPAVAISAPVSEASLKAGSVFAIKWTASDNIGVVSRAIYYSVNNGTSWTKVDSVSGNTGTFNWTVPNTISKTCKVQIYAYDAAGNKGTATSSTFAIDPATGIVMNHQFNIPIAEKYTVTIMNIQGKELIKFEVKNLEQINQMNMNLPSGIHIVNISTPDKMFVTKMKIVQ